MDLGSYILLCLQAKKNARAAKHVPHSTASFKAEDNI